MFTHFGTTAVLLWTHHGLSSVWRLADLLVPGWCLLVFPIGFLKVLEDICLLVGGIVSDVLLDVLDLLYEIKFIFLCQVIQV